MRVALVKGVALVVCVVVCALALVAVWRLAQRRVHAARAAERLAVERRDRFLSTAAAELDAPLAAGRVDEARRILKELVHSPAALELEAVDVGELLRAIVSAPPFSDRGPPVILRAEPVRVRADRGRLMNGLSVLLWTLRRAADPSAPLTITVSFDEVVLIEIDAQGTAGEVASLERMPQVMEGAAAPAGAPGVTLAMRVAAEVARLHGGQLSARALAGQGERFVLSFAG